MINANALKHPRTAWSIEAALWIAAEEREAAIQAIDQVTGLRVRDGRRIVALSIYEAGYRLTKGDDK